MSPRFIVASSASAALLPAVTMLLFAAAMTPRPLRAVERDRKCNFVVIFEENSRQIGDLRYPKGD